MLKSETEGFVNTCISLFPVRSTGAEVNKMMVYYIFMPDTGQSYKQ